MGQAGICNSAYHAYESANRGGWPASSVFLEYGPGASRRRRPVERILEGFAGGISDANRGAHHIGTRGGRAKDPTGRVCSDDLGRDPRTSGPRRDVCSSLRHHPILSKTDDPQSEYEIRESWERVRSEVDGAVPVFCYPNGDPASFGPREVSTLSRVGLSAAVTAVHGYVVPRHFAPDTPEQRYMLPRFPYPEDRQSFLQVVTGFERVKLAVRQRLRWLIDR